MNLFECVLDWQSVQSACLPSAQCMPTIDISSYGKWMDAWMDIFLVQQFHVVSTVIMVTEFNTSAKINLTYSPALIKQLLQMRKRRSC